MPWLTETHLKELSLQAISRFTFTILLAIVTSLGAFALAGCTDGGQQSQSASTEAAQSESTASDAADSSSADDEEQDNCYGNDLPAVKK